MPPLQVPEACRPCEPKSGPKRHAILGEDLGFILLFVGDVVGSAGCSAVLDLIPTLREQLGLDAVVARSPQGGARQDGEGAASSR